MGPYLSVTLLGEGPASRGNRLARDLGCEAERARSGSLRMAVPVCNPFWGVGSLPLLVGCGFCSLRFWCVSVWHACGCQCGLLDYPALIHSPWGGPCVGVPGQRGAFEYSVRPTNA